jgi:hypothetical protein
MEPAKVCTESTTTGKILWTAKSSNNTYASKDTMDNTVPAKNRIMEQKT